MTRLLALAFTLFLTHPAFALSTPFQNLDAIASQLQIQAYKTAVSSRTVKVAVLDNGFKGYAEEIGSTLPSSTVFHAGPVAVDPQTEEAHGLFMAQMIAGLLDRTPGISYELHLFSAFGYSNLEKAVETIASENFDVALYAQVWEYGGNGDGRGFINSLVNRATAAGVLWVNASGNFADATYRAPVAQAEDDWARLPGPNNSVQVRCQKNSSGKCQLRAVLSWNDFKDDVKLGTDKDLDLVLTDDTLKIIRTSGLKQQKEFPEGQPGSSLYPREIIQAELTPGLYYLRVKIRSQNFDSSQDELRLVTSGDFVQQIDTTKGETLLAPADNASVITVGASDAPKSGSSATFKKPDLFFPSSVVLENGEDYKGSSNSSAVAAAAVTILKALKPSLVREEALRLLGGNSLGSPLPVGEGLPLYVLQFGPTGPGCFQPAILPYIPQALLPILKAGAVTVATTSGLKVFTPFDPFALVGAQRNLPNDMLVIGTQGWVVWPRALQWQIMNQAFEVVQMPQGQQICGFDGHVNPPQTSNGQLRLPHPGQL